MKFVKLIFISLIVFSVNCCSPPKEKNNLSTHKIIFLTPYFEEYVKARKTYNKKMEKIFTTKLYDLMVREYFWDCEYLNAIKDEPIDTADDIIGSGELSKTIELIKSKQKFIRDKINTALLKCYTYLPYDGVTVFVCPNSENREELERKVKGVGGLTVGSKHIILSLDPSIKGWEDMLEIAVAHEFNHTYWIKYNLKNCHETLLERLEVEGKAETFSHLLYPNVKEPWDSTLTEKQKKELWNKIKNELGNTDYAFQNRIMFGDSVYPFDGGYILGRDIVTAALKKSPNIEAKNWTNFSPDFILKTSGYKWIFPLSKNCYNL